MMTEKQSTKHSGRPFFLSALSFAFLVYAGFLTVLFLISIFSNKWLTNVLSDFLPEMILTRTNVFSFSLTGFILYGLSSLGTILILRLKRIGFYLILFSTLLIILIPHLMGFGSTEASIVFSAVIILFAIFFRKLQ